MIIGQRLNIGWPALMHTIAFMIILILAPLSVERPSHASESRQKERWFSVQADNEGSGLTALESADPAVRMTAAFEPTGE